MEQSKSSVPTDPFLVQGDSIMGLTHVQSQYGRDKVTPYFSPALLLSTKDLAWLSVLHCKRL